MRRRKYTVEFKRDAVAMQLDGVSVGEVSKQLRINQGLLYRWKAEQLERMEASAGAGEPSHKAQAEEIAQLRKQ